MKEIIPYIYKITFIPAGKVYIGARFNKGGCVPSELWVEGGYFTSSRHIKKLISEYGIGSDVWNVEILEVFTGPIELSIVPKRENEIILEHLENLGAKNIINRRWVVDGKEVYSNAGMNYKCPKISAKSKGYVSAKDADGNIFKVTQEEFDSNDSLVGIGSGTLFIHNPETGQRKKIAEGEIIPDGWVRGLGKTCSDENKQKLSDMRRSKVTITDGIKNTTINVGEDVPDGWRIGITRKQTKGWSEERRTKRAETMKRKKEEKLALQPPKSEESKKRSEALKRAADKRKAAGIPHGNTGKKKSLEEISRQQETRRKNKNRILEGF